MSFTQKKTTTDVKESCDRVDKNLGRRLDDPASRGSAAVALDQLRKGVETRDPETIAKTVRRIVGLVPSDVLEAIQPALTEAKWYVYDYTGKEIPTDRI